MNVIFTIRTADHEIVEREYVGTIEEKFAAFADEFPIGSVTLIGTRSVDPIVPLVTFASGGGTY